MNSSPIESWEGAGAYFTFADQPLVLILIFCLTLAATVLAVVLAARHESQSYAKTLADLPHNPD